MKLFTLLLLTMVVSCAPKDNITKPKNNSLIIENVNIVDVVNQKIVADKTIVIRNGVIETISNDISLLNFPNIEVIDGKGGYVTPGLIDMHVHMYEEAAYILTLSHGVTHVRIMNGLTEHLLWRDNIELGTQIGSSSSVSSPIISGNKDVTLQHGVLNADEAKKAVRQYHDAGYDLIKAYGDLNKESLLAIVEQGKKLNIPIAKHGPHASGDMPISLLNGLQSFEHVEDIYQGPLNHQHASALLPKVMMDLKATKVAVTPTLNIYYQLTQLSKEKEAYLSATHTEYTSDIIEFEALQNQAKRWLESSDEMASHNQKTLSFLIHITKVMHDNDIPLLVGSDSGVLLSPHGIATHTEMKLLEQAGLSAFEVLRAATVNPAKALKLDNKIGQVSENFNADFIYTKTNPIDDLKVLKESEAVINNGYWYARNTLNSIRKEAIDSRSFWKELGILIEGMSR